MDAHELLQESAYTLTQRGEQNGYDKKEERMFTALLIIGILAVSIVTLTVFSAMQDLKDDY